MVRVLWYPFLGLLDSGGAHFSDDACIENNSKRLALYQWEFQGMALSEV